MSVIHLMIHISSFLLVVTVCAIIDLCRVHYKIVAIRAFRETHNLASLLGREVTRTFKNFEHNSSVRVSLHMLVDIIADVCSRGVIVAISMVAVFGVPWMLRHETRTRVAQHEANDTTPMSKSRDRSHGQLVNLNILKIRR